MICLVTSWVLCFDANSSISCFILSIRTNGGSLEAVGEHALLKDLPETIQAGGPPLRGNRLLGALNRANPERIAAFLEPLEVKAGSVLCWAAQELRYAYFPDGAVLSVLMTLTDGSAIETAKIGREGAFGLFEAMYTHTSFNQCMVLLGGTVYRMPFNVLRALFENDSQVRTLFVHYAVASRQEFQQAAACFALHSVPQRICRWLLTMDDRAESRDFVVTHDFLAHSLAVNRKSVTLAAQTMQKEGLISYRRAHVRILDRPRLEQACCECYAASQQSFEFCASPPPELSFAHEGHAH